MSTWTVSPRTFLRIAQVNLVLVVVNIVTGAAVRLSDSGLGCPDWPNCTRSHLTAPLAGHRGIEFGNRLVVVAVVVAAAVAVVAAWRRRPTRRDLTWLASGLVGGVVGEAVVGGIVVYSKLNPYVVMTHFLLGVAVLTDAAVLARRAGRAGTPGVAKVGRAEVAGGRLLLGLTAVVIAAGTAATGAGPHAGGQGARRIPVPLDDLVRTHSGLALVLVAATLGVLWGLHRHRAPPSVRDRGQVLLAVLVGQAVVGYTQFFTHLPPVLVGVHVFGAAMVWLAVLAYGDGLYHHEPEVDPVPAGPLTGVAA